MDEMHARGLFFLLKKQLFWLVPSVFWYYRKHWGPTKKAVFLGAIYYLSSK